MCIDDILVSVIMTCYNHEKYVRKAIESVLGQKTNFNYEMIIHDDASTDSSASIIKEYEKKYPDKIKVIYQEKNQYQAGVMIRRTYINPLLKGKYIAVCECDDYWCDENKLQKQVDFLETHSNFTATTHNCRFVNENDEEINNIYHVYRPCRSHVFTLKRLSREVIYPGQTAAIVYRKSVMNFATEKQEYDYYHMRAKVGDIKRNLQLLLNGDCYFFEEKMSAYRIVTKNSDSWSSRNYKKNLSFEHYVTSIDLRKYAKKYYGVTYANYYSTFHAGIGGIVKYITKHTDENKGVYEHLCADKGGIVPLLCYLFILGIRSIPLLFIREYERRRYDIR